MKVVVALGANALLRRDQPPTAENQLENIRAAALQLAQVAEDLCTSLLARELQADLLIIATDVPAVYIDWGSPTQRALGEVTPQDLAKYHFAEGSMGPKVEAARNFVLATGKRAVIGSLDQIEDMLAGNAGTRVYLAKANGAVCRSNSTCIACPHLHGGLIICGRSDPLAQRGTLAIEAQLVIASLGGSPQVKWLQRR